MPKMMSVEERLRAAECTLDLEASMRRMIADSMSAWQARRSALIDEIVSSLWKLQDVDKQIDKMLAAWTKETGSADRDDSDEAPGETADSEED